MNSLEAQEFAFLALKKSKILQLCFQQRCNQHLCHKDWAGMGLQLQWYLDLFCLEGFEQAFLVLRVLKVSQTYSE